ncbi:MAG: hypothetical protein HKN89_04970 [Eudoraea sp.]|nr:hypothetical protein [Eudoraea sp.]
MKPKFLFALFLMLCQSSFALGTDKSTLSEPALSIIGNTIPLPEEVNQPFLWIKNRQLSNGLVESVEGSDFVSLYDNALSAIVFTLHDDRESAEKILDYFNHRLDTEFIEFGGGFYQFRRADGSQTRRKWIGDNAWLLIAINYYSERFSSTKYDTMALAIENWLRAQQDKDGGLWGGMQANGKRIHKITEGIITAYNAVPGYDDFHRGILTYLEKNRFDKKESLFLAWPENPKYQYAMDLHSLGSLIYPSLSEKLLTKVDRYGTRQLSSVNGIQVQGYCFDEDKDVIWLEGTAQMALAFLQSGMKEEGQHLLKEIKKTMIVSNTNNSAAGVPYSVNQGTTYGSSQLWEHADQAAAISSSAWYVFALKNFNPLNLDGDKNIPAADKFWLL